MLTRIRPKDYGQQEKVSMSNKGAMNIYLNTT